MHHTAHVSDMGPEMIVLLQVIVIKEFSMLSARFLDKLEEVARIAKSSREVFGGVRIILVACASSWWRAHHLGGRCGAAATGEQPGLDSEFNEAGMPELRKHAAQYAFKAAAWPRLELRGFKLKHCTAQALYSTVQLKHCTTCWRYPAHERLGAFLAKLRVATRWTPELCRELQSLYDQRDVNADEAVVLCCTNALARAVSARKLSALPGPEVQYFAVDHTADSIRNPKYCTEADEDTNGGGGPTYQDENQCDRSLFGSLAEPAVLRLRKGARVLCTSSIDAKVRTGAIGVVRGFADPDTAAVNGAVPYAAGWRVDAAQALADMDHVQTQHLWPEVEFETVDGAKIQASSSGFAGMNKQPHDLFHCGMFGPYQHHCICEATKSHVIFMLVELHGYWNLGIGTVAYVA